MEYGEYCISKRRVKCLAVSHTSKPSGARNNNMKYGLLFHTMHNRKLHRKYIKYGMIFTTVCNAH